MVERPASARFAEPSRICIILLWALLVSSCCPSHNPKVSTNPRLVTGRGGQRATQAILTRARKNGLFFARSGKHKEALAAYLFAFDGSRQFPAMHGSRLSFLLGLIVHLGQKYPPAITALRKRRDECGTHILSGTARAVEYAEFSSLNHYLGEHRRAIQLYRALLQKGPKFRDASEELAKRVWRILAEAKQYEALAPMATFLSHHVARQTAVAYQSMAMDPKRIAIGKGKLVFFDAEAANARLAASRIKDGVLIYRVLLEANKVQIAHKIQKWLLRFKKDAEIYRWFIAAARSVKKPDLVKALVKEATTQFPSEKFEPGKKDSGTAK